MEDERDFALSKLEDDLEMLEQHAKHVIGLLGRHFTDLGTRVEAIQEASRLYAEIRQIKDRIHALRGKP
jgi:hypothetical protein